jgi:hypothetical protein
MPTDTLPAAGFTVADLCRRWRVGEDKVRALIRRGELAALDLRSHRAGRPQYRVTHEAVIAFEQRRSTVPPPKPKQNKRQQPARSWNDFFPDEMV